MCDQCEKHPEIKEGELLLENIDTNTDNAEHIIHDWPEADSRSDWEAIGWKTKRMGEQAFTTDGRLISGMRPVFVQKSELDAAGIKLSCCYNNAVLKTK